MTSVTMMMCGHAANGKKGDQPVCVICAGLKHGWDIAAPEANLAGRKASCACGYTTDSSSGLAFFESRPDSETDRFYCGCHGWD